MAEQDPTVVAVYELVAADYQRVAEFRVAPNGTVELTLAEPGGCPLARQWFRDGITTADRQRTCTPADGAEFLRAVLRSRPINFTRVVDESRAGEPRRTTSSSVAGTPPLPTPRQL
ncbi:hypothetical protein ABZV91_17075 [Nocardia sp. NPDC004568]|uniref:hypothetical protein n=1 Tax=Nocardia sp. NPDC004568 TaxID=3154551 RepID=UPI0033A71CCC